MYKKNITVTVKDGLHDKTAASVTKTAVEFKDTNIYVYKDNLKANAKNIMAVLSIGAVSGSEILIEAEGPDEEKAVEALCAIL